jgi:nucleoside-diphosphate-sugar epimerase
MSRPYKILILGGYGTFGGHLAQLLAEFCFDVRRDETFAVQIENVSSVRARK